MDEAKAAASYLIEQGCTKAIITMGSQGAVLITKDKPDPVHITTQKVTPVDATVSNHFISFHLLLNNQIKWPAIQ